MIKKKLMTRLYVTIALQLVKVQSHGFETWQGCWWCKEEHLIIVTLVQSKGPQAMLLAYWEAQSFAHFKPLPLRDLILVDTVDKTPVLL